MAHSPFCFLNTLLRALGQFLTGRDYPIHTVFRSL
jgi:hypothetical protein